MILELKHIGTPEQHFASRPWTISWQTIQFGSVELLARQALSHTIHPLQQSFSAWLSRPLSHVD